MITAAEQYRRLVAKLEAIQEDTTAHPGNPEDWANGINPPVDWVKDNATGKYSPPAPAAEPAPALSTAASADAAATDTVSAEPPAVAAPATDTVSAAPAAAPAVKPRAWNKGVLGLGSKGPEVKALQQKLGIPDDSSYGPATKQAVMDLQKKLGVNPADGVYGPQTKAAHDKSAATGITNVPPADKGFGQKGPTIAAATGQDPSNPLNRPQTPAAAPATAPSQAYAYTTTPEYKQLLATLQSTYQSGGQTSPAYLKAKADIEAFAAKNKPVAESVGFTNDELTRIVSLIHYR